MTRQEHAVYSLAQCKAELLPGTAHNFLLMSGRPLLPVNRSLLKKNLGPTGFTLVHMTKMQALSRASCTLSCAFSRTTPSVRNLNNDVQEKMEAWNDEKSLKNKNAAGVNVPARGLVFRQLPLFDWWNDICFFDYFSQLFVWVTRISTSSVLQNAKQNQLSNRHS